MYCYDWMWRHARFDAPSRVKPGWPPAGRADGWRGVHDWSITVCEHYRREIEHEVLDPAPRASGRLIYASVVRFSGQQSVRHPCRDVILRSAINHTDRPERVRISLLLSTQFISLPLALSLSLSLSLLALLQHYNCVIFFCISQSNKMWSMRRWHWWSILRSALYHWSDIDWSSSVCRLMACQPCSSYTM